MKAYEFPLLMSLAHCGAGWVDSAITEPPDEYFRAGEALVQGLKVTEVMIEIVAGYVEVNRELPPRDIRNLAHGVGYTRTTSLHGIRGLVEYGLCQMVWLHDEFPENFVFKHAGSPLHTDGPHFAEFQAFQACRFATSIYSFLFFFGRSRFALLELVICCAMILCLLCR
jgi:hypothetical protein